MAPEATTGTRLEQIERLRSAYPSLPIEAILKEDVLTEGIAFPPGAPPPAVLAIEGGPLGVRRAIVRARSRPGARYALECMGNEQVLVDTLSEEPLAVCRAYSSRPEYMAKRFPSGRAYANVLDPRGVAHLPLADPKDPAELAEAAAETYVLQPWTSGEMPLAIRLVPDPAVQEQPETEQDAFILPYITALRARIGNIRPIFLTLPPRDRTGEERLFEAGATGRVSNLEVWGRDLFGRMGPRVGLNFDAWIARILEQSFVYMDIHVQPTLLVGKELSQPDGFVDRDTARRNTEEGIRFLLAHRVLVRLVHWVPPDGQEAPPVEYYLDLDQAWYEIWRETHREEPAGELLGPGHGRDPDSAHLDLGRGANLAAGHADSEGDHRVR